ncbi:Bug family tripartite tricarboxylate transporter substrate binding protein [Alcaligenes sp. SMD-FA]|uniref:Bug family tripartite tricarboxylate transporter substrate binding protein n=1 Tax=Alcaligenes sp. SMD-FA TaxID=2991054 RepID=UPI0022277F41|nr:tripartite tricarboxylate transporter substrate binding protein [Alcaligenes sp. SMD-FA]UYY89008.1 tripartite tricarboxylate transporter substrate binding protein [Alcaligenes sp. SMD-FA]
MRFRPFSCFASAALSIGLLASSVQAQTFPPQKSISLVVGFAAGGAADAAARMIAKKLGDNIGQTVVVQNKAGAGGILAHQQVANADNDGSVLLLGSVGPMTISPHLMKVPYDPFKDLAPLSGGVHFPNVLVVHKGIGAKTLSEFIELAKSEPGLIDFASSGSGSASHLAGELLNQRAGVEMVHVPYRGGGQALQDLIGERVASYFAAPPTAAPHIKVGTLIPLATTGLERSADMPTIPTVAEAGYPGFIALNWYAFLGPGTMPEDIQERWNQELVKVLNDPEIRQSLLDYGLTPQPTSRAELTQFMEQKSAQWRKTIQERGLKGE